MKKIKFLIVLLFFGVFLVLGVCSRSVVRADSVSDEESVSYYSILNINSISVNVPYSGYYYSFSDNFVVNKELDYQIVDYQISSDQITHEFTFAYYASFALENVTFRFIDSFAPGTSINISCGPFVIPKSYFTSTFSEIPTFTIGNSDFTDTSVNFDYSVYRSNRLGGDKEFYTVDYTYSISSVDDFFYMIPYNQDILSDYAYGTDYLYFESLDINVNFNNTERLDGGFLIDSFIVNDTTKLTFLDWENNINYAPAGGTPMLEWLTVSINAFLNTPIFGPTITIGTLMLFIVAIPLVIALLKFFVGG